MTTFVLGERKGPRVRIAPGALMCGTAERIDSHIEFSFYVDDARIAALMSRDGQRLVLLYDTGLDKLNRKLSETGRLHLATWITPAEIIKRNLYADNGLLDSLGEGPFNVVSHEDRIELRSMNVSELENYFDTEINITELEEDILDDLELNGIAQYHIVYFKDIKKHNGECSSPCYPEFCRLQEDFNIKDEDLVIIQAP